VGIICSSTCLLKMLRDAGLVILVLTNEDVTKLKQTPLAVRSSHRVLAVSGSVAGYALAGDEPDEEEAAAVPE
jgi:hypothetical protein